MPSGIVATSKFATYIVIFDGVVSDTRRDHCRLLYRRKLVADASPGSGHSVDILRMCEREGGGSIVV